MGFLTKKWVSFHFFPLLRPSCSFPPLKPERGLKRAPFRNTSFKRAPTTHSAPFRPHAGLLGCRGRPPPTNPCEAPPFIVSFCSCQPTRNKPSHFFAGPVEIFKGRSGESMSLSQLVTPGNPSGPPPGRAEAGAGAQLDTEWMAAINSRAQKEDRERGRRREDSASDVGGGSRMRNNFDRGGHFHLPSFTLLPWSFQIYQPTPN